MADSQKTESTGEALMVFTRISGWVGGPIIVALFAGRYLDQRYGTAPWYFLGLTGLAFVASAWGIIKETKVYMEKLETKAKNPDSKPENKIE